MYHVEYMGRLSAMRNQFVKNLILIDREQKQSNPDEMQIGRYENENEKIKEKFEKLYTEYRNKARADDEVIEENEQSCKYAYITFRCMDALDYVRMAYDISWWRRNMIMRFGTSEQKEELLKLHFFKKWPTVHVASEPDNIKWANLRYSLKQRCCRQSIIWLVAAGLVFLSLIGIVVLKNESVKLKAKYKSDSVCPPSVTKYEAWFDH